MKSFKKPVLLLSRILQLDADATESDTLALPLSIDQIDWQEIIRLADKEHMTAALAASLRRHNLHDALPKPVRAALDRRNLMGTEINRRIKRQAEEAVRILNGAGCTPMIFKGALHLFEASPDDIGGRMMRDLDILVPEERLQDCISVLRNNGYVPEREEDGWTYHYHPLHHKDHIVGIELHFLPGEQRNFLTAKDAWEEAVPVAAPGLQLLALGPSHRVAHNIFHSEIQDHGFVLGEICLRQLYDLAKTCNRFNDQIDWRSCLERFERHGIDQLFRSRVYLAKELLGGPKPTIVIDNARSRLHLAYCFSSIRSPRLMEMARWCAGVADRLSRYHIDLLYKCGTSGTALQVHRAKHIWNMLRRHRGSFGKQVAEHGRRL